MADPNLDPETVAHAADGGNGTDKPRMWREVSLDSGEISIVPPNPAGVEEPPTVGE